MVYEVAGIEVLQKPAASLNEPKANYAGFKPSTTILPKGHKKTPENLALPVDIVFDRDVPIKVRDGVTLRADVHRPTGDGKYPALLAWSPYGKSGAGFNALDYTPGRVGVWKDRLSGYEKFESLDPAEWIPRGYAVVQMDSRGSFDSEGDLRWPGSGEAEDGHDSIEVVAKLPWCTGKVATMGNSWLAISQWAIAASKPPSLACIAPFEGVSDFYRETIIRGGVPFKPFWEMLGELFYGHNKAEDIIAMVDKYPFYNAYWDDKRVEMSNIEVPAYILASYSTQLHSRGSFRGYEEIKHKNKIRCHPRQEWNDLYNPKTNEDLQKFLDYYTKGIQNGWEKTPHVRFSLIDFKKIGGGPPEVPFNVVFPDWPHPETKNVDLYLAPSGKLVESNPSTAASVSYKGDEPAEQVDNDKEEALFYYTFTKKTNVVGYPKVILNINGEDHVDDLDVFVQLRKADASGKLLQHINVPLDEMHVEKREDVVVINPNVHLGPNGILRASHRAINKSKSTATWPHHDHTKETQQKLKPGEIVKLDIALWPTGIVFDAGEQLVLKVAGHPLVLAEFTSIRGKWLAQNKGQHTLHFGGKYDSKVIIPTVDL